MRYLANLLLGLGMEVVLAAEPAIMGNINEIFGHLLQGLGREIVPAAVPAFLGNINDIFGHFASGSEHGCCSCDRVCFCK